jgi:hypothetical protein
MIEGFARLLSRHEIRFVIVGGQAVAREVPTATEDIDALILVEDLQATAAELAEDPTVKFIDSPSSGMARGQVRVGGAYVDFDLLDPSSYSGRRPGPEFFSYVHRRSTEHYAPPPVVWYMRLVVGDRGVYGSKIATDIRNGAPTTWLEEARRIARRFGTLAEVEPGIAFVRKLLEIAPKFVETNRHA